MALVSGTVSTSEVTTAGQTLTPPKACVLNLPVANLLAVELACGESRVSTANGAPSAFGSGAVAGVDLAALSLLDPVIAILQSLLNQLLPVVDQTVGTVLNGLPAVSGILGPLAGNLGLGSTSTVQPVTSLVNNLLGRRPAGHGPASTSPSAPPPPRPSPAPAPSRPRPRPPVRRSTSFPA